MPQSGTYRVGHPAGMQLSLRIGEKVVIQLDESLGH
jgi:hypothetical protein